MNAEDPVEITTKEDSNWIDLVYTDIWDNVYGKSSLQKLLASSCKHQFVYGSFRHPEDRDRIIVHISFESQNDAVYFKLLRG